jgi:hypothetical protein
MAVIRVVGFKGENRALQPLLLDDMVGVTSTNQKTGRGDLRPWNAPLTVATVGSGRQTIYRMGRDTPSDTNYWLSWTTVVDVVRGYNSGDTAERTYYSGSGGPKWTDTTKALGTNAPVAYRELGVPAPAAAPSLSASGGVSTTTEQRAYVSTFVTDAGEESAPSSPTTITCKADDTVMISSLSAAPSGSYGITLRRIYRTESTTAGAEFFFLREIASSLTSTTDDGQDLGEVIPTTTWLTAPGTPQGGTFNLTEPALTSLTGMWNGMMAGITGRSIRFCEPFVPYAWPIEYEIEPPDITPVALAVYGQTLVALTNGKPIIIMGGSPEALDEMPLDFLQACIAPRSVVSLGHGVCWASPEGLAYVGQGPPRLLTLGLMTRDDWQAIKPETIIGALYRGQYFGFYQEVSGTYKAFVIDPLDPSGIYFLDFGVDAVYVDDLQGVMYALQGTSIYKWDAGSALTTTFRSKLFRMPKPMQALACAEVVADGSAITFKMWADGNLVTTQSIPSNEPFRLPAGYYFNFVQFEVSTQGSIQSVAIAHSIAELMSV